MLIEKIMQAAEEKVNTLPKRYVREKARREYAAILAGIAEAGIAYNGQQINVGDRIIYEYTKNFGNSTYQDNIKVCGAATVYKVYPKSVGTSNWHKDLVYKRRILAVEKGE